jgi:sarcosine oxidase subunit alpha
MIGHVTSSYWSENIGRSIALALVRGGHQKEGQRIYVRNRDGETIAVNISSSVFFDPEGERQNV